MAKSNLYGLSEKDMQVIINTYSLNPFYWASFMPTQFSPSLSIKTLQNTFGIPVAGDVVAFDSKAPRKSRRTVARIDGEIPKIEIARELKESELNTYMQLLAFAQTGSNPAAQRQLIEMVYGDLEFCWNGVNAKLEQMFGQIMSTGKCTLSSTTNPQGIKQEAAIDYLVPDAQKIGVSTAWTVANKDTAKPITDLKAAVKAMRKLGIISRFMLTNQDTFDILVQNTEVQKLCAPWVASATGGYLVPGLDQLNAAFLSKGLPQVVIIENYVNIEDQAGTQTATNIWTDGVFTLIPEMQCGNVVYAQLAEELNSGVETSAYKVRRAHVLLKKYAEEDPYVEMTVGSANAIPVWASSQRSLLIDSLHSTFTF